MKSVFTAIALFSAISLFAQKDGEYHLDQDFNLKSDGTIELSTSDAKVFITGSKRANVHLKVDRTVVTKGLYFGHEEFAMEINDAGGDLRIREKSSSYASGIVGYYKEEYEIKIEAPEGASVIIKGDDGDYVITNVNGSISMNVDDADIDLFSCSGDKFRFRLDDGDLRMDEGKGSLDIEVDDGDIEIKNGGFTSIVADIDDGDFVVETSLSDKGEYNIRAQDGLVAMSILGGGGEFNIRHDDARVFAEGGFDIREKTETYTTVSLPKGSAKVDIRADDAKVKLTRPTN
ncbi:MAG: DUF4097 family beta strand repeat-containing protein [Cyclobacteriaceae bacterium]